MRQIRHRYRIARGTGRCYVRAVVALVASLDTSLGTLTADFVLLALVVVNGYLGWRLGLMRRLVGFAGLYVGVLAASNIGNGLAAMFAPHSLYANAWMFTAVLVFVVVLFEALGWAFNERLQRIVVFVFDRIVGTATGVIVGVAQALVLFLVAYAVAGVPATNSNDAPPGRASAAQAIQASTLGGQVVRMEPQARAVFGPVLPSDLTDHLAQGTQISTLPGV
ncbi:MAG: CvpA family protein [Chloroflexi bacterium]|nr:MAG: CvpA family protein [Chloroflexota bacterium]